MKLCNGTPDPDRAVWDDGTNTAACGSTELHGPHTYARRVDAPTFGRALHIAEEIGTEHGTAAASWYDVTDENARGLIRGIEEGNPIWLDTFPQPDLSGEWADRMNASDLMREVWLRLDLKPDEYEDWDEIGYTDICDSYEMAFSTAVEAQIDSRARYMAD